MNRLQRAPLTQFSLSLKIAYFKSHVEHKVWSNLLTHVAGLAILIICYCAHSILVRGVYLDGEEPGADAAALPYYYVRYFILVRKKKPNKLYF